VAWAREFVAINTLGPEIESVDEVLTVGDVVYVRADSAARHRLSQLPGPEGAFVALDPRDGAVLALVGGYAFERSKFNRVSQASRQPGSNFKPFVYAAALENGLTLASVFNDAPVVFADDKLEDVWRPENYSGRVYGPTRLREALVSSRNLVSIRVLRKIGVPYTVDYARRFGFVDDSLPRDLSLSLGSGVVKPLELVNAYAVFANGGHAVEDLAGKTGTTNEQMDAWFTGYHPSIVATAWVGFDQVRTLGAKETGGQAALPMWIDFMREALEGVPQVEKIQPDRIVRIRINRDTGKLARAGSDNSVFEVFRDGTVTRVSQTASDTGDSGTVADGGRVVETPRWSQVPTEARRGRP